MPIFCMLGWVFGLAVMAVDVVRFVNNNGNSDKVEQEYQQLKCYFISNNKKDETDYY